MLVTLALLALISVTPALAGDKEGRGPQGDNGNHTGWVKNGKEDEKLARRAAKESAKPGKSGDALRRRLPHDDDDDNGRVVINAPTVKRSPSRGRYYGNRTYHDPYCTVTHHGHRPYSGPYYGNSGPYSGGHRTSGGFWGYLADRDGDLSRSEVAERAAYNGYRAGYVRGQYDSGGGNRLNPYGHGAYEFGLDGWSDDWGWGATYQQVYRQYFVQGYNDGFNRRNAHCRYERRY
jgi:hypothetical protein